MKRMLLVLFFVPFYAQGMMETELMDFAQMPRYYACPFGLEIRSRKQQLFESITNNNVQQMQSIIKGDPLVLNQSKKISDNYYITPLCEAVACGSDDCIQKLLELAVDPNRADNNERSIFCYLSRQKGHLAQLLIKHGADVNRRDNRGRTALMYLVLWRHLDIEEGSVFACLLCNGANVNIQDNEGNSALHIAVASAENKQVIDMLLMYGADKYLSNKKGIRPVDLHQWPNKKN